MGPHLNTSDGADMSSVDVHCDFEHTTVDPTDDQFRCPECKAAVGDFAVDDGPNFDCPKLHTRDDLRCYGCGYTTTGRAFSARIMRAESVIACPTCKGKGTVKDKSPRAKSKPAKTKPKKAKPK